MTTKIFWNIAVFLLATLCPVFCAVAAVRDAPANRPPAVRDAITGPLRDDSIITLSNVTDQVTSGPDLEPVTIIATATSQPDVPIPVSFIKLFRISSYADTPVSYSIIIDYSYFDSNQSLLPVPYP